MTFIPLTPAQVHAAVARHNPGVTFESVRTALAGVDQHAVFAEQRARITHQVWDRKSPINGCSPELILSQPNHNIPGGEIYLLLVDNQVTFIQPFKPRAAGFVAISKGEVSQVATDHADELAAHLTAQAVVERVRGGL